MTSSCDVRVTDTSYVAYNLSNTTSGHCAEQQQVTEDEDTSDTSDSCHDLGDSVCASTPGCAWNSDSGQTGGCHSSDSSGSDPTCLKTVVADFQAGDGTDYTISIDGDEPQLTSVRSQITLCEGDTLNVTRPDGFTGHPLRISDTDGNTVLGSNTGTVPPADFPEPGDYPYKCTLSGHESMSGIVKVLSTSDPECSCDSSSSDDSGPSHACDAVQCPTGFTQRSSLPAGDNPSAKQCCRPMRKGCKTSGKWTYDESADEHDDSLCVDAQTATEKDNEVGAASGYDAKRNVHKKHAKEAFYKERLTKSKKAAIRAARATIPDLDLPQRVMDRKKGTVKVAVAINDADDDSCEVGAQDENCASLDLEDEAADDAADETTILMTEGDGKWAVVVDGSNVIVKQTQKQGKFDMQCWTGSSWGTAESKDPSTDASIVTHKCGSHVFMVGSLQQVCVDCTDGCDEAAGLCYVPGCTDATASNYDASANTDDGSCVAVANGCTDATAFNYDASANTDDGSCVAVANGCTDATACNYDTSANTDDGSCTHAAANKDCSGVCLNDVDGDGVCDEDESEASDTSDLCNPAPTDAATYINNQCCQCP